MENNDKPKKLKMKPTISTRGIPSSESVYLPRYDSNELRKFQDDSESMTRNIWRLDEVVNFVFPKKYQPKYNEISLKFLSLLMANLKLRGEDLSSFINQNSISKATFYNRVLPRLKRVGMIKVERESITQLSSKKKYRPMVVSLSKTFGNYFVKIGDSWLALVDDARTTRKKV